MTRSCRTQEQAQGAEGEDQQNSGDVRGEAGDQESGESMSTSEAGSDEMRPGEDSEGAGEDEEGEIGPGSGDEESTPQGPASLLNSRHNHGSGALLPRLFDQLRRDRRRVRPVRSRGARRGCARCSISSSTHLQGVIGRLANRLQRRRLMAKQTRAWEFDLEEGMLDAGRLARVVVNPMHPLSYKREKDTDFHATVSLLIDNSGSVDARPADLDRCDQRRHIGAHA